MGFYGTSDGGDWLSVVWWLTCKGGWVIERDVVLFDVLPHKLARRKRGREGRVGGRGEATVPKAPLGRVWAILGFGKVKVEGVSNVGGIVNKVTYADKKTGVPVGFGRC